MDQTAHILVVGETAIRERCLPVLGAEGYSVDLADSFPEALEKVRLHSFDLLIFGIGTRGFDTEEVRRLDPQPVIIAIDSLEAMETTLEAAGEIIYESIPENFTADRFLSAVHRGLETSRLRAQVKKLASDGEEAHRAAFRFIGTVAHELRAPLAAIESYLSAYLSNAAGPDPETNRRMLERAKVRSHALIDLVGDLLQYVRLESDRAPEKAAPLDLSGIIVNTAELFRHQAQERSIQMSIDLPDRLPPIEGRSSEMEQLFTNLISNAIKYNKDGGKVTIRAEKGEKDLCIIVSDTGIGIGEEGLPRIFDEFYRESRPETRYTTGTGLGLTLVRKIVETHSGRVKVESKIDAGTTFVVELPIAGWDARWSAHVPAFHERDEVERGA